MPTIINHESHVVRGENDQTRAEGRAAPNWGQRAIRRMDRMDALMQRSPNPYSQGLNMVTSMLVLDGAICITASLQPENEDAHFYHMSGVAIGITTLASRIMFGPFNSNFSNWANCGFGALLMLIARSVITTVLTPPNNETEQERNVFYFKVLMVLSFLRIGYMAFRSEGDETRRISETVIEELSGDDISGQ